MNATVMQPISLKALAARVRLCNSLCNSNATTQNTHEKGMQLSMQLSPENDPKVAVVQEVNGIDVQKMKLSEFEKAGLIVKVYSEILQDHIYFISNDAVLNRNPLDLVAYTAQELTAMISMEPEEVRTAHMVKTIFRKARITERVAL